MIKNLIWRGLHHLQPKEEAFVAAIGAQTLIRPLRFKKLAWNKFEQVSLESQRGVYIALVPYDQYACSTSEVEPVIYQLQTWQEVDLCRRRCLVRHDHEVDADIEVKWSENPSTLAMAPDLRLVPNHSNEFYLAQVNDVLARIREGQFYQLNLLRYFQVQSSRGALIERLAEHPAPYCAYFQGPDHQVISFSPERFLKAIRLPNGDWAASTFPIKGTLPSDSLMDLLQSKKDMAELSMIIDLMRNDLSEVAKVGSVSVPSQPYVRDFGYVKHLIGEVAAHLPGSLKVGQLMRSVLPAGSITGAPKRAVMEAIADIEGRPRHFVMGNMFWLDLKRGFLDSSVLIRTAQVIENEYEFAAGSGIVIKSDPSVELMEVQAKCQALGQRREKSWNSTVQFI